MVSKLAQYGLSSISARPAIHFLPSVWTSLHLSYHATANELWNKIFLMIIFSQEINFAPATQVHWLGFVLDKYSLLSHQPGLPQNQWSSLSNGALLLINRNVSQAVYKKRFKPSCICPDCSSESAHGSLDGDLFVYTDTFFFCPPRPLSPASGCLQPAGFCCPRTSG